MTEGLLGRRQPPSPTPHPPQKRALVMRCPLRIVLKFVLIARLFAPQAAIHEQQAFFKELAEQYPEKAWMFK